jgi:hypothetical protein
LGAHSRGLGTLLPRVRCTKPWKGALRPWPNSMAEPEAESSQASLQRSFLVMLLRLSRLLTPLLSFVSIICMCTFFLQHFLSGILSVSVIYSAQIHTMIICIAMEVFTTAPNGLGRFLFHILWEMLPQKNKKWNVRYVIQRQCILHCIMLV